MRLPSKFTLCYCWNEILQTGIL